MASLENLIKAKDAEALLITNRYNLRYLTGFSGTFGIALIIGDAKYLFIDFRYKEQAEKESKDCKIIEVKTSFLATIYKYLQKHNVGKLAIEGNDLTLYQYNNMKKIFKGIKFITLEEEILNIRMIKNIDEIKCIKKAVQISDMAFKKTLNEIKVGQKESDIATNLEYIMRKGGAQDKSFDIIVASGVRSSMPHAVASDKKIKMNEFVKIDFGCIYKGYCSDITRTVFIGDKISKKHKEVYNIVLEAQLLAISKIKEGVRIREIDKVTRDFINKKGYGENFKHALGHGVGLEVHELPNVSPISDITLKENMVITIEPGIYIEGFGGVRIEDDVLVTKNGCEVLSKSNKELTIITGK